MYDEAIKADPKYVLAYFNKGLRLVNHFVEWKNTNKQSKCMMRQSKSTLKMPMPISTKVQIINNIFINRQFS